jgi:hypothetical protein
MAILGRCAHHGTPVCSFFNQSVIRARSKVRSRPEAPHLVRPPELTSSPNSSLTMHDIISSVHEPERRRRQRLLLHVFRFPQDLPVLWAQAYPHQAIRSQDQRQGRALHLDELARMPTPAEAAAAYLVNRVNGGYGTSSCQCRYRNLFKNGSDNVPNTTLGISALTAG